VQARLPIARRHLAAAISVSLVLAGAALVGVAHAARSVRPSDPSPSIASLRRLVVHYRTVTWTFERAANVSRAQTTFTERHTRDRAYLRWAIDHWTRTAYVARRQALDSIHRRFAVKLPPPPRLRASFGATLAYNRRLTLALRGIYPGGRRRRAAAIHGSNRKALLRAWQGLSASAALAVSLHAERRARIPAWLGQALQCIHRYEGAWDANTGNGYYGGLQMDLPFQSRYGERYLGRYGTADRWPVWAQLETAARAYRSGRGFHPWPNTARACGLE
jgi:hypothetical protein